MPKPTRTAVAVAIAFVVVAAYGACVVALATSMYGALIVMPHATPVGIAIILLAAFGLLHLVKTRGVPSHSFCLVLLLLEVICTSVLFNMAVHGVAETTSAVEIAPALTTYQTRMDAFLASDKARQYTYYDSLVHNVADAPPNPLNITTTEAYPLEAARAFTEAYCVSQGHRVCSALPLVQTIVLPGIWRSPNVTAEIARNLSTLPATLVGVTVTATTTIDSFCARVNVTVDNPQWDSVDVQTFLDRVNDPARLFKQDIVALCHGCAVLVNATTKHTALQTWIHGSCPMTVPKPAGAACIAAVGSYKRNDGSFQSAKTDFSVDQTYRNPAYDACFGHTLMSVAHTYDRAVAIASGALLCMLLLLSARVWVVRRVQRHQDAVREAAVQTPVDNA